LGVNNFVDLEVQKKHFEALKKNRLGSLQDLVTWEPARIDLEVREFYDLESLRFADLEIYYIIDLKVRKIDSKDFDNLRVNNSI